MGAGLDRIKVERQWLWWMWQGKETRNKMGVKRGVGSGRAGQNRVGWVVHGATQTWMGQGGAGLVKEGRCRGRQEQAGRQAGRESVCQGVGEPRPC